MTKNTAASSRRTRKKKGADEGTAETPISTGIIESDTAPDAEEMSPLCSETATAAVKTSSRSETVVVALNRPHGVTFQLPDGRKLTIKGNGIDLRGKEKGVLRSGAYGFTIVPRDDWEQVKKIYGRMPLFKNGCLVDADDMASAESAAAERRTVRNGLEPFNPSIMVQNVYS